MNAASLLSPQRGEDAKSRAASSRFVLLVSDDGVGLPPSVDVRQTDSLGLQLVCTLADQLRGELRVERGAGTAFRLEFDGDA